MFRNRNPGLVTTPSLRETQNHSVREPAAFVAIARLGAGSMRTHCQSARQNACGLWGLWFRPRRSHGGGLLQPSDFTPGAAEYRAPIGPDRTKKPA